MKRTLFVLFVLPFLFFCGGKTKPTPGTDIEFNEKKIPWEFISNATQPMARNRIVNKAIKDFYIFRSVTPFQEKEIPRGKFILAVVDQNQLAPESLNKEDGKKYAQEWFEKNVQPLLLKTHTYKKMKTHAGDNFTEYTSEIMPGKTLRVKMYHMTESPYLLYYIFIWNTDGKSITLAQIEKDSIENVKLKAGSSAGGGEI